MRSRVARNKGENRVTEYPLMSAANGGKADRCMVCPQKLMGNARYASASSAKITLKEKFLNRVPDFDPNSLKLPPAYCL